MTETGGALRVEELTERGALGERAAHWRALAESHHHDAGFFVSWEWTAAWLEAFQAERGLSALLVWRGSELVGALPLLLSARRLLPVRRLASAANAQSPRSGLLCAEGMDEEVQDAVFARLASGRAPLDLSLLSLVQPGRLYAGLPGAARRHGLGVIARPVAGSPVVRFAGDWNAYLASRDKHTQKEWARKKRRLAEAGRVEVVLATKPSDVPEALAAVLEVEENSWKQESRTSFTTEKGVALFYDLLARSCAERGWLRLFVLRVDGRPVAHVFGIVFGGEFLALKTSFDQRFAKHSPGVVLILSALEAAVAEGQQAFDLLGSPARWKAEMTSEQRERVDVRLFTRGLPGGELELAWEERLKPWVRRHAPSLVSGSPR